MSTPSHVIRSTTLDTLLQSVPTPIRVYDQNWVSVYVNPAYASIFGSDYSAANDSGAEHSTTNRRTDQQDRFFGSLATYVEKYPDRAAHGFPLVDNEGQVYLVEIVTPSSKKKISPAPATDTLPGKAIGLDPLAAAWMSSRLSAPDTELAPIMDLRGRVEKVDGLPCLPAVAQNILALSTNPNANTAQLAHLIESDPMLAAQLLRWASSPFYGKRNKLKSVQDAINVVGFDMVINLALGVASLRTLQLPKSGPLAMQIIWRHSVYSATLMSMLAERVSQNPRPGSGLAYLTGLLHNIGLFLLGHQFPREFELLSRLVGRNPGIPISQLEKFAFGTDHARLGTWLLSMWGLPEDLCVAVAQHHNVSYVGTHKTLAQLCLLADHALATVGMGDGLAAENIRQPCCDVLGIAPTKVQELLEQVMEKADVLDAFAAQTVG